MRTTFDRVYEGMARVRLPDNRFRFLVGSAGISAGSGVVGLSAFRDDLLAVYLGLVLFVVGFRICQSALSEGGTGMIPDGFDPEAAAAGRLLTVVTSLFVGLLLLGFGIMAFARAVRSPGLRPALVAGTASIGGYLIAHIAVQGSVGFRVGTYHEPQHPSMRRLAGTAGGLAVTALALGSGSIWAYQGRPSPVFFAAGLAWLGYLIAHYAAAGTWLDTRSQHRLERDRSLVVKDPRRVGGFLAGVSVLVSAMYLGSIHIPSADYLVTNIAGVLFLGGYVLSHYYRTGTLL